MAIPAAMRIRRLVYHSFPKRKNFRVAAAPDPDNHVFRVLQPAASTYEEMAAPAPDATTTRFLPARLAE